MDTKIDISHTIISFEFSTITIQYVTVNNSFQHFVFEYRLASDNCRFEKDETSPTKYKTVTIEQLGPIRIDVNEIKRNYSYTIKWPLSLMTISTDEAVIFNFMFCIVCNNAVMLRFCGLHRVHNINCVRSLLGVGTNTGTGCYVEFSISS